MLRTGYLNLIFEIDHTTLINNLDSVSLCHFFSQLLFKPPMYVRTCIILTSAVFVWKVGVARAFKNKICCVPSENNEMLARYDHIVQNVDMECPAQWGRRYFMRMSVCEVMTHSRRKRDTEALHGDNVALKYLLCAEGVNVCRVAANDFLSPLLQNGRKNRRHLCECRLWER